MIEKQHGTDSLRACEKIKIPVAYARGSERTSPVWEELQSRDRQGVGAFAYFFTASHGRGSVGILLRVLSQLGVQRVWLGRGKALNRPLHKAILGHRYGEAQADGSDL